MANVQVFISIVGLIIAVAVVVLTYDSLRQVSASAERVKSAEKKAASEPEKVKPTWDLARVTLEAYLNRNLAQIRAIFALSVFVMIVGFGIVIWGVSTAIQSPDELSAAILSTAAGLLTQFIGATFLLVFRSTMKQASDYSIMLERINSVGMAMQILDTLPEEATDDDLKSRTKARLVELLIKTQHQTSNEVTVTAPHQST